MTGSALSVNAGHDNAPSGLVKMPEGIDPASVPSLVQAIENALEMPVARQEDMIARADQLAEIALGSLDPSSERLNEDQRQRMHTVQHVFAEGEWLTSDQLHAL